MDPKQFNFPARIHLFTNQSPNAICVEVGTRHGDLAFEVVTQRPDIKLTVVDNWEGKFADGEANARQRLTGAAEIIKANSVDAALHFKDESLDFVYIDAAHDFDNVLADCRAWWPKVKKGGIMAGHDYENKPDDGYWGPIEVRTAVDRWALSRGGLQVNVVEPQSCPSWWAVKP